MLLTNSHANNISWHELFIYCKTSFVLLKVYTNLTKKFLVERGVGLALAKRRLIPHGHEIDKISPSAGVNNSSTIQLYSFTPAGILVHQELCRNSLVLL